MSRRDPISKLYGLPLAEFTTARNELARELRAAGDRDGAESVKKLGKPSVTAWAINQLYREHRATFDELLVAATDQRQAVQTGGAALRTAAERQRKLQAKLLRAAEEILGRAGTRFSPALRQRVSRTLDALAAWPPESERPPLGRLTADLEPVGFDALMGARIAASTSLPRGARRGTRPATARPKSATAERRLKEVQGKLDAAQTALAEARKAERAAKSKLTRAEAKAERTLAKARATELAAEKARELADAAQLALRKARAARDRATQATERQEASVDSAQRKLADLA